MRFAFADDWGENEARCAREAGVSLKVLHGTSGGAMIFSRQGDEIFLPEISIGVGSVRRVSPERAWRSEEVS